MIHSNSNNILTNLVVKTQTSAKNPFTQPKSPLNRLKANVSPKMSVSA